MIYGFETKNFLFIKRYQKYISLSFSAWNTENITNTIVGA